MTTPARRVVVAVPACPPAASWIAGRLAIGPALRCAGLDDWHDLPAEFAGGLDVLVWCVAPAEVRVAELRRAVALMRPLRVVVVVVPAGFLAGDPPGADPAPHLGALRAALVAAITDRPVAVASAGWAGEVPDDALELLAGRLLRDPPGGEHQR